jgi:transcription elongation factor Elf1
MEFTAQQKKKIKQHIHDNPDNKCICPVCHKDDWQIADEIIQVQITGNTIPSAYIICNNCGLIMHHLTPQ